MFELGDLTPCCPLSELEEVVISREGSPITLSNLPPRIGINGFNGMGRLALRAGLAPRTQFFPVSFFCKKQLICLEGKSVTPCRGNIILFRSSQQLPRLRLGPLKGFFELTRRPSRALNLSCALLPELPMYKDTVMGAAPSAEVPGQRQE